jgi:iron complex outermembrane receptor protein
MNDSLEASDANHGTDPATSYIQLDAHDHITIVKGQNSVLYGASMGGLVIFNEIPKSSKSPGRRPGWSAAWGVLGVATSRRMPR